MNIYWIIVLSFVGLVLLIDTFIDFIQNYWFSPSFWEALVLIFLIFPILILRNIGSMPLVGYFIKKNTEHESKHPRPYVFTRTTDGISREDLHVFFLGLGFIRVNHSITADNIPFAGYELWTPKEHIIIAEDIDCYRIASYYKTAKSKYIVERLKEVNVLVGKKEEDYV